MRLLKSKFYWMVYLLVSVFFPGCGLTHFIGENKCEKSILSYNYLIENIKERGVFDYQYYMKTKKFKDGKERLVDVSPYQIDFLQKRYRMKFNHIDSLGIYYLTYEKLDVLRQKIESECPSNSKAIESLTQNEFDHYDSLSLVNYFQR